MAKVLGFTIDIKGTRAAIENATDIKLAISEINKALKQTTDAAEYRKLEKELIRLKGAQKEVNAQLRQAVNEQRANLDVAEDSVGAYRRLSAQLNVARNRYKDLAAAGKENTDEAKALVQEVTRLDKRLKSIDADVGQFQRNVGNYENAIRNALPGLSAFSDGLDNIRNQATRTGKVLAAGFLTLEIINQLFQGARAIKEFADEFIALRREVNRQTGLIGEDLGEATARTEAIAKTYGESAEEIIRAANAVSREFGVSINEALDRTADAFLRGADNSNELLDSLREYSSQIDDIDALFNILIRASQEGIYSDKGIDAVKEFNLRILEQTPAVRKALEGAFGEKFTRELFSGINDGSITTTQALARVTTGLRDMDLTASQAQGVIANVFGGPGEDAGRRFLELLADVDQELGAVTESTDLYKAQQQELFEANLEVARAQDALAEALEGSSAEFDILSARIKAFLLEQGRRFIDFFESVPAFIAGAQAALVALGQNLRLGQQVFHVGRAFTDAYKAARREVRATNEAVKEQNELLRQQRTEARKAAAARSGGARGRADEDVPAAGSIADIEARLKKVREELKKTIVGSDLFRQLAQREKEIEAELTRAVAERNRAILEAERRGELQRLALLTELGSRAATQVIADVEDEKTQVILDKIEARANAVRKALAEQQALEQEAQRRGVEELGQTLLDQGLNVLGEFSRAASERRTERLDREIEAQEDFIGRLEQQAGEAGRVQRERLELQIATERSALRQRVAAREAEQQKLAKKEKALAVIQSIIQTALAVSRALANPPGPPFSIPQAVAAGVQGAAQTAIIAAQPLATGGIVGRTVDGEPIRPLSNGDNVLATLRRGEVVLNDRQQALLGGASTFARIGVPGFAAGGIAGNMAPRLPRGVGGSDEEILEEMRGLRSDMNRTVQAVNQRIDRLRAFVVSEDVARDLEEENALRVNATLS